MKLKSYGTEKGYTLSLKNKLENAVNDYLEYDVNRIIITTQELEEFKERVINRIMELNSQFPRCKPIDADWWPIPGRHDDYKLTGVSVFTNYMIKEFELPEGKCVGN